eukprot:CFRG1395T1
MIVLTKARDFNTPYMAQHSDCSFLRTQHNSAPSTMQIRQCTTDAAIDFYILACNGNKCLFCNERFYHQDRTKIVPFHQAVPVNSVTAVREICGNLLGCAEADLMSRNGLTGHQIVCHHVGDDHKSLVCHSLTSPGVTQD